MDDERFMARAIELASRGNTSPNPMVGAVIVRDGEILGEGFHEAAGLPHAEVNALEGVDARGSTLYVNLEPCSHHGRTPPCTDAIIRSGISRVVCAMKDPNPLVDGIGALRKDGIEVEVGVLGDSAAKLNEIFIKYTLSGTPFVTLKTAMSLDGKISTNSGDSKWITSDDSRRLSRAMRGRHDAIVVGVNTVLMDDPSLKAECGRDPLRVVLDSRLRAPPSSKVFDDDNVLVVTSKLCNRRNMDRLEYNGIEVLVCGERSVDVVRLLKELGERGVTSVFVEGGGEVNGSFVRSGSVDKYVFFIAPKIIGGRQAPGPVGGGGILNMAQAIGLVDLSIERIGGDIIVIAYPDQSR